MEDQEAGRVAIDLSLSPAAHERIMRVTEYLELQTPDLTALVALALLSGVAEAHRQGASRVIFAGGRVGLEADIADVVSGRPYHFRGVELDG